MESSEANARRSRKRYWRANTVAVMRVFSIPAFFSRGTAIIREGSSFTIRQLSFKIQHGRRGKHHMQPHVTARASDGCKVLNRPEQLQTHEATGNASQGIMRSMSSQPPGRASFAQRLPQKRSFKTNTGTNKYCFLLVCVCFLPIHSGHQVRWTYQPGSHRRKVTQDF